LTYWSLIEYDDSNDVIADRGEDDKVVGGSEVTISPELWFYRAIAHVFETSKYRMTIPELTKGIIVSIFWYQGETNRWKRSRLEALSFRFIATATSNSTKFLGATDQIIVKQCLIIGDWGLSRNWLSKKNYRMFMSHENIRICLEYEFSLNRLWRNGW
jgi:hypothetical protein